MMPEQDEKFSHWQNVHENRQGIDGVGLVTKYHSLCHCLFGDDIVLPEDPHYDYLLLEHSVNPSSATRGEKSLNYFENRLVQPSTVEHPPRPDRHALLAPLQSKFSADPYSLDGVGDAGLKPQQWSIPGGSRTDDSGYASGPKNETPGDSAADSGELHVESTNYTTYTDTNPSSQSFLILRDCRKRPFGDK
ncbi:hypothetical protein GGR54DRAFT_236305 [Hypoxylon sp. NC1633]|nr:hypothetical protein GGR54DRAFT_236305 [Hypoxylon sp. NC1633]